MAPQSPAPDPPTPVPAPPWPPSTSDLPPIAAKADDLEAIKKAVEDAASVGGALWLSYLFVLFYLAVAAGAVTHADLFFEHPVKLPFLNIELPLLAFFFLAPILFLIVHAYTLVHLVMLSDKAKRFHQALHDQIGDDDDKAKERPPGRAAIRAGLQRQLPSNIFVQFLAGPPDIRASLFGWMLRGIAWSTLVIAPILLLLMMQIQFLPFHSSFITWTHRLALLADLGLLWWLWREILSGRAADGRRRPASWGWTGLGFALSACAVLFSWTAATFPGEWQEGHLTNGDGLGGSISLHDVIFNLPVDPTTRRRRLPFSSTLVLSGLNVYEGLRIDDPEKAKWRDYVFLRPRPRSEWRDPRSRQFAEGRLRGRISAARVARWRATSGRVAQGGAASGRRRSIGRSFRARRSVSRSFRIRSSIARGLGARRSITPSFRARRSMAPSFRARSSTVRAFRARRSTTRSFRARRFAAQRFSTRRSRTRNFRARLSTGRNFRAPRSSGRGFRAHR